MSTLPVELRIGDTVTVEGLEFVLYCINRMNDLEGHTVVLHGMDVLRAMKHMEKQEASRKAMEYQEQAAALLPKMSKALDDGST